MKLNLLVFTLLCIPLASGYVLNYTAANMQCWITPDYRDSQPLLFSEVEIPVNATQVLLNVEVGMGRALHYKLRECRYISCTTYQYYNTNCNNVVGTFGFGTANLTDLVSPGEHFFTLESLEGFDSRELTGAVLSIHYPDVSLSLNQSFSFLSNATVSTSEVKVNGSGLCNVGFPELDAVNASVSSNNGSVDFNVSQFNLQWQCNELQSPYAMQWLLPAIQRNQRWMAGEASLYQQEFYSVLRLHNPSQLQNYSQVPFSFYVPVNFSLETGQTNGYLRLNAGEEQDFESVFTASVLLFNYSVLAYGELDNITLNRSIMLENSFNESAISLNFTSIAQAMEWPCSGLVELEPVSSTQLQCISFPAVNYSFYNNSFSITNNLSTALYLHSVADFATRLTGLNYSAPQEFTVPQNSTVVINLSIIEVEVTVEVPSAPSSMRIFASGSGVPVAVKNLTEEKLQREPVELPETDAVLPLVPRKQPNLNFSSVEEQIELNLTKPAEFSGFATAANIVPFALLGLLLLALPFAFKGKRVFQRSVKSKSVTLSVFNRFKVSMKQLVLVEALNSTKASDFSIRPKKLKTVIGPALSWRRELLAPGETWIITYKSHAPKLKKARLVYIVENEKKVIML